MKLFKQMVSGVLALSMAFGAATFTTADDSVQAASDAVALVEQMGMGWNLGNTFDSAPVKSWVSNDPYVDTEVGWGNPTTTKAMMAQMGMLKPITSVSWVTLSTTCSEMVKDRG